MFGFLIVAQIKFDGFILILDQFNLIKFPFNSFVE